ncbi:PocR ligand-binding domain-containing protein [Bacillaceae bacterium Marseille-Q3522]|nr:PocR ligand-binding domain-containing protein [Bacillaceae bacterium Marseille-Q3522]
MLYKDKNLKLVEKIMDEFASATGLACVAVDIHGIEVTKYCNFTPFCQLIRSNPKYRTLCQKCDLYGGLEASKSGKPLIYRCHAGLIDISVPIILKNQLSGFLQSGQIILEDDDCPSLIQTELSKWQGNKDLQKNYQSIPFVKRKKVVSSAELLTIISDYYIRQELKYGENTASPEEPENDHKKEIKKALKYIDKHLNEQITLDEVANYIYLSPYYFSKLFKKETGVNFINYVNEKKIEKAKELLKVSDWSVDSIAKNLGFSQTSYFCKVFRNANGITPKKYRDSLESCL